ncbi:flippase-like domain-containing protein [Aporhodopirellula aestuarii]|uniref:Flippase-like domain-containing protein n=1 Tax=Aporhodopirellula aestuarii TaxID=2950107 RepID=A0ABT0U9H5_9BACT|nr:flippase-like domain-containing protein [Aporhodopirellula aestuarii]MCM2373058.1 flippase-like domain-containing protein [Aporhodopirellula aestuarii]
MVSLAWIKRLVFLIVLIGLFSATNKAVERWQNETSALRADVLALQERAAEQSDPHAAAQWQREADLRAASIPSLASVRWTRVGGAAFLYALGLMPAGLVLHRCLRAFAVNCTHRRALAAQLLGHLGKYIPGKAMVVFLRIDAVLPKTQHAAAAQPLDKTLLDKSEVPAPDEESPRAKRPIGRVATCVFFETLLMMGVGGALAGVLLWNSDLPAWVRWFAAATAIGSAIPVCPPVLRRLVEFVAARRRIKEARRPGEAEPHEKPAGNSAADTSSEPVDTKSQDDSTAPITWTLLGGCYLISLVSWLMIGLSFAVLITAIPSFEPIPSMTRLIPMATAAISLGMVIGFASLLPGGAGVREYVTLLVLMPVIGETQALLAVIAARLMFIAVETLLAGLAALYLHMLQPLPHG